MSSVLRRVRRVAWLVVVGGLAFSGCGGGSGGGGATGPSVPSGWAAAQLIGADQTSNQLAVAVDAAGNAIAVWADGGRMRASRFAVGQGWSTVATLGEPFNIALPRVAFDAAGRAIVVWSATASGRVAVLAARHDPAVGWTAPESIVPADLAITTDTTASAPDLFVGSDGQAVVAWRQATGAGHRVWATRYAPGRGWAAPELAAEGRGNASRTRVAGGDRGRLIAVWHSTDGVTADVRAVRFAPESGWGPVSILQSVSGAGDQSHPPEIAMSASGEALVVWNAMARDPPALWASRYSEVSGWEPPRPITGAGAGPTVLPVVALDGRGAALVVWNQETTSSMQVWSNHYAAGAGWESPRRLDALQPTTPTFPFTAVPRVALAPGGIGFAVWVQMRPDLSSTDIYAARYSLDGGWSAGQAIDSGMVAGPADIAVDSAGNAVAVWTQGDYPLSQVWSARYAAVARP